MDTEKYKNDLLDQEIRRMAREEGVGWLEVAAVCSIFPIMIFVLFISSLFTNYILENATSLNILLYSFSTSITMSILWLPFGLWSFKSQSKKTEIAYNRLRSEYGLEAKHH